MADRPFNLGIDPVDAQARLQQLLQPTQYAMGGMVHGYAKGGPVYDELGNIVIGDDTDYRDVPGYSAIEAASIGAGQMGQAVGEPIKEAAEGMGDVPSSIARYLAETSEKPDPSQRMAEDIRRVGGAMYDQAMSSPTEFAKTVGGFIPGVGEAISAYDAKHLYGDLQKAEAEGDTGKADTLRQLYGLATAGAIPGVGIGARVAGKVAQGAERAIARELSSMGLYSHGAETAAALQQAKGAPEQMAAMLQKYGVKPDEMYATGFADEAATAAARSKIESEFAPKVAEAQRAMEGLEPGTPEFKAAERQFKNISSTMRSEMDRALVLGDEWSARPSVTRDEIAAHFKERMPQIEETVLGGSKPDLAKSWETVDRLSNDLFDAGITEHTPIARGTYDINLYPPETRAAVEELAAAHRNIREQSDAGRTLANAPTKFGQYTLPGGENYREVLLKLPIPTKKIETKGWTAVKDPNGYARDYLIYDQNGKLIAERAADSPEQAIQSATKDLNTGKEITSEPPKFKSSHWDDPNVLAHLRMADRTGPNGEKILHVEEIQSDWGQKGKKEGFDVGITPQQEKRMQDLTARVLDLSTAEREELGDLLRASGKGGVPSAPYVTNTQAWTDLALKRALREAAEGGYDKLVWTPGAEQAKRYDLSRHVDNITWSAEPDGKYWVGATKDGRPVRGLENEPMDAKKLEATFGKEIAEKIVKGEGKKMVGGPEMELSGLDLQTGGSGMKGYYDKIVPTQLSKLVKKLDPEAKVGMTDVMLPPKGGIGHNNPPLEAPGITITPKMREAILGGQTAFAEGGSVDGAAEAADLDTLYQKYADPGYAMGGPVGMQSTGDAYGAPQMSAGGQAMANDNLVYNPDEIDAIAAQIRGVN